MLQAPIRQQQQDAQDLNMRMGEQRLELGEQRIEDMKAARAEKEKIKARREKYIGILSEHYGDPAGMMKALKDAGMVEEMNAEYKKMLALREQRAKTNTAEWKEEEGKGRSVSETISGLLRLEGPDRDEQYQIARNRVLSVMPEMEPMWPDSPDETTYETLADSATMMRTGADQMAMDEAEFKKVESSRKRQEGMDKKAEEVFDKAIEKLSNTSKGFWEGEVRHQRKRIEKYSPDRLGQFDEMTAGGHNRETKSALKEWAGEGKSFTGEYGNYRKHAEEKGETPIAPLDFSRAMAKARKPGEEEKDPLTPTQALALIHSVKREAATLRDEDDMFFDMSVEESEKEVARKRNLDWDRLLARSVGEQPQQPEFYEVGGKRYRKVGPDQYVEEPQ